MGSDKALIELDGVALAVRVARCLQAGGCISAHLVGRQPELAQLGLPVLVDEGPDRHPLRGVAAALSHSRTDLALFAPCDLISLTPHSVGLLLDHQGPCVAQGPNGMHPLLAVLPRHYAAQALRLAQAGQPAHALVTDLPRVTLPGHELTDANRPVDLPSASE